MFTLRHGCARVIIAGADTIRGDFIELRGDVDGPFLDPFHFSADCAVEPFHGLMSFRSYAAHYVAIMMASGRLATPERYHWSGVQVNPR